MAPGASPEGAAQALVCPHFPHRGHVWGSLWPSGRPNPAGPEGRDRPTKGWTSQGCDGPSRSQPYSSSQTLGGRLARGAPIGTRWPAGHTKGAVWTNGSLGPPFFIPEKPESQKWLLNQPFSIPLQTASPDCRPARLAAPLLLASTLLGAGVPSTCGLRTESSPGSPR